MGTPNCKLIAQSYRISDTIPSWLHKRPDADSPPDIHNSPQLRFGEVAVAGRWIGERKGANVEVIVNNDKYAGWLREIKPPGLVNL